MGVRPEGVSQDKSAKRQTAPQRLYHRIRHKVISYPRWLRTLCGIALVIGGLLGFLPVLGFWMIPLGLVVLSYDSARLRRWRRKLWVRVAKRTRGRARRAQ